MDDPWLKIMQRLALLPEARARGLKRLESLLLKQLKLLWAEFYSVPKMKRSSDETDCN